MIIHSWYAYDMHVHPEKLDLASALGVNTLASQFFALSDTWDKLFRGDKTATYF